MYIALPLSVFIFLDFCLVFELFPLFFAYLAFLKVGEIKTSVFVVQRSTVQDIPLFRHKTTGQKGRILGAAKHGDG